MIQYLTNEAGQKTAVMIPIQEWENIQAQLQKRDILESLYQGYTEMQALEKRGVPGKTRAQLLQELQDDSDA